MGIGISYGRALMVKAGHNGGAVNDIVWLGDVVNEASTLCGYGNKGTNIYPIMISDTFYNGLSQSTKTELDNLGVDSFFYNMNENCYHANITFVNYDNWVEKFLKK